MQKLRKCEEFLGAKFKPYCLLLSKRSQFDPTHVNLIPRIPNVLAACFPDTNYLWEQWNLNSLWFHAITLSSRPLGSEKRSCYFQPSTCNCWYSWSLRKSFNLSVWPHFSLNSLTPASCYQTEAILRKKKTNIVLITNSFKIWPDRLDRIFQIAREVGTGKSRFVERRSLPKCSHAQKEMKGKNNQTNKQKHMGFTNFVLEGTCPEEYLES